MSASILSRDGRGGIDLSPPPPAAAGRRIWAPRNVEFRRRSGEVVGLQNVLEECMDEITATQIVTQPVPLWLVRVPSDRIIEPRELFRQMDRRLLTCVFRAVAIERLPVVLKTGVDVEPPDAVLFADFFDKAWEYGGWPKLILAFDPKRILKSCRVVPNDLPPEEMAALCGQFPTVIRDDEASTLWLSRLRPDDPRAGSAYEAAYAYWIPGDPMEALRCVLICTRPQDEEALRQWCGDIGAAG